MNASTASIARTSANAIENPRKRPLLSVSTIADGTAGGTIPRLDGITTVRSRAALRGTTPTSSATSTRAAPIRSRVGMMTESKICEA